MKKVLLIGLIFFSLLLAGCTQTTKAPVETMPPTAEPNSTPTIEEPIETAPLPEPIANIRHCRGTYFTLQ